MVATQQEGGTVKNYRQRRRRTAQTDSPIAALPAQTDKTSLKEKSVS